MVVTNTFAGTLPTTDPWYDKSMSDCSKTISLSIKSDTDTTTKSISCNEKFYNIFMDALEKTLKDAGYTPIINQTNHSIELFGLTFYIILYYTYSSDGYNHYSTIYPIVYYKNKSESTSYGDYSKISAKINTYDERYYGISARQESYYSSDYKYNDYSFSITVRGSENFVAVDFAGMGYETQQSNLFYICKATNISDKSDYIGLGNFNQDHVRLYKTNDLYTYITPDLDCITTNFQESLNPELGIGKGYMKIPQFTYGYGYMIKGMITMYQDFIVAGKYYKIGNEIYYANYNPHFSNAKPYLYKVDTIVTS